MAKEELKIWGCIVGFVALCLAGWALVIGIGYGIVHLVSTVIEAVDD